MTFYRNAGEFLVVQVEMKSLAKLYVHGFVENYRFNLFHRVFISRLARQTTRYSALSGSEPPSIPLFLARKSIQLAFQGFPVPHP